MLEIIELVGRLLHGFRVWRIFFSKDYRHEVRSSWKTKSRLAVAFEIFELTIGFVLTFVVAYAVYVVSA